MSVPEATADYPLCPVTGEPAAALIQTVSCEFLARLWEIEFKVDARPSFGGATHLSLWRSPTGLMFFSPAPVGDADFYKTFYKTLGPKLFPSERRPRAEFRLAASHIASGARVLDVGCGFGGFRPFVAHADYLGLDPHFSGEAADWSLSESLGEHLIKNAGAYDAVCAFQVLEHVERPADFFAEMTAAAKPGGLVIVGVPHVPSAMTRIPNFLLNAPPHHLTWWSEDALRALAGRNGLAVETIQPVAWSKMDSLVYWIERCSPVRCRDVYFKHAWPWHAAALTGLILGYVANKLFGPPRKTKDEGAGLLLAARKPLER
ncbi:Methyltransferase type 11 [Methylocella silvestris BL2]|uniref:Methyltransferase type 11 n=1 Tax=Methylocella silvestris (strain DSM 15510 / CIP 108128 / LMG 27833 / NCIMB 13906 / BL2) TaxID=395965 RepID=B8ERV3_METSB|nr:class I SAM-dependent methyltransferase [Methylocella silvestris]ACK51651.1 Methyltransferase type 11 [Methylocella silvestris BL2]